MYDAHGHELCSNFTPINSGVVAIAPYEGCYFKVFEVSWPIGEKMPSIQVTVSDYAKIETFTPYLDTTGATNLEVEIEAKSTATETANALMEALNAGGTVKLMENIDISGADRNSFSTRLHQGWDVVLDLNGHTLTMGVDALNIEGGKAVTITNTDTVNRGKLVGHIAVHDASSITLNSIDVIPTATSNQTELALTTTSGARNVSINNCVINSLSVTGVKNPVTVTNTALRGNIQINSDIVLSGGVLPSPPAATIISASTAVR
jgi:hypothetical protein